MSHSGSATFESSPWRRKVVLILLSPIMVLLVPLVLVVISLFGAYAVAANYNVERRLRSKMRRGNRYLSYSDVRRRISERGSLIIESPSLGWNVTRAWWTPDDLLSESAVASPNDEQRRQSAKEMRSLDWDEWCWRRYTSPETGKALLLRVWNGESLGRKLKSVFSELQVVRTWTALVHVQSRQLEARGDGSQSAE